MTHDQYKKEREKSGTQEFVSKLLGVHRTTIARRETQKMDITVEAELAIKGLAQGKAK